MKKDVFVIGAGASVPYGFPTGFDLLQQIKDIKLNNLPDSIIEQLYIMLGGEAIHVNLNREKVFGKLDRDLKEPVFEVLQNSCTLSIDQFLKNHLDDPPKQKSIKTIMTYIILRAEDRAFRKRFDTQDSSDRHLVLCA